MASQATTRKIKRSFTLTSESVEFVRETRVRLKAESDSEALDQILKDMRREAKLRELDAAAKEYYDNATDEELREQLEWARGTSSNM